MPIVVKNMTYDFKMVDTKTIILMIILGIVHTGIAYLLYFSSIKHVKSKSIVILSYIDPVVVIVLSIIFLGETINLFKLLVGVHILFSSLYE